MIQLMEPEDITEEMVAAAVEMRDGLYGNRPLSWWEIIDRLETDEVDFGSDMNSPAIRKLQREVRKVMAGG